MIKLLRDQIEKLSLRSETSQQKIRPAVSNQVHDLFEKRDCLGVLADHLENKDLVAFASVNRRLYEACQPKLEAHAQHERALLASHSVEDFVRGISKGLKVERGAERATRLNLNGVCLGKRHLKAIVERFTELVEIQFNTQQPMEFSLQPLQNLPKLKIIRIHAGNCKNGEVRSLVALERLSIDASEASEAQQRSVKDELRNMTHLRELRLAVHSLSEFEFLKNLINLKKLEISRFCGPDSLDTLACFEKLRELAIEGDIWSQASLPNLRADALKDLKSLRLTGWYTAFKRDHFDQIAQMSHLVSLELESSQPYSAAPSQIQALQHLQDLTLRQFIFREEFCAVFIKLKNLKNVEISGHADRHFTLPNLDLPELRSLRIEMDNVSVDELTRLENLESIRFDNLVVKKGRVDLPKLKDADVSRIFRVNEQTFENWSLPALETADFGAGGLPAKFGTIKRLSHHARDPGNLSDFPDLEELTWEVGDRAGRPIRDQFNKLDNLKGLKKLKLYVTAILSEHVEILNSLTNLEQLTFHRLRVNTQVWGQIQLPNLRVLQVAHIVEVYGDSKLTLAHLPKLEKIVWEDYGENLREHIDLSSAIKQVQCLRTRSWK